MSAPECKTCVCAVTKIGYRCDASVPSGGQWVPGTACPFLVINAQEAELAAKEAEIEKLREALTKILGWREYYDHWGETMEGLIRGIEETASAALNNEKEN